MDSDEKRWIMAINVARTFSLGSLCWIRNALWRERIDGFGRRHPHGGHPAICFGEGRKLEALAQFSLPSQKFYAIRQGDVEWT